MPVEPPTSNTIYTGLIAKRLRLLALLALLLVPLTLLSLRIGSYELSTGTIISSLLSGNDDALITHLIWHMRLPRTVAALLAGSGLALSGALMQTLLRNPLAAPSTLGVSQGAAFGAAAAIILLGSGQVFSSGNEGVLVTSRSMTASCAFAGSLVSIVVILTLAGVRQLTAEAMILAGVAVGAFLAAGTMLLQYFASDQQVAATLLWTFGDLGKAGWTENGLMALVLILTLSVMLFNGWSLTALQWGDETASSLGVSTTRLRLAGMLLTCLLVSITTAFLGIIAFVGLMAPHLMRPLIGNDQRFLLPASALCGAVLLLLADILSRTVMAPVIIPVGIITSFAGAPLFLLILVRRKHA